MTCRILSGPDLAERDVPRGLMIHRVHPDHQTEVRVTDQTCLLYIEMLPDPFHVGHVLLSTQLGCLLIIRNGIRSAAPARVISDDCEFVAELFEGLKSMEPERDD